METRKVGEKNRGNAGRGRPKGVPNKSTASTKAALTAAFTKLGGVPSLVRWGKENPSDFYKLWSKLVPVELTHQGGVTLEVVLRDEAAK